MVTKELNPAPAKAPAPAPQPAAAQGSQAAPARPVFSLEPRSNGVPAGAHSAELMGASPGFGGAGGRARIAANMQKSLGNARMNRMLAEQAPSAGQPLDGSARREFEARFQRDLSAVRIHSNAQGKVDSIAPGGRAVTIGNDIYFGSGLYDPQSPDGRELLAHELTHVVQQEGATGASAGRLGARGDKFESEAQRNAGAAPRGGPLQVRERSPQKGAQADDDGPGFFESLLSSILKSVFPQLQPILDRGVLGWIQDRVTEAAEGIMNAVLAPVHAVTGIAASLSSHFTKLGAWIKKAAGSIAKGDCSVLHEAVDYIEEAVSGLVSPIIDKIKEVGSKIGNFFSGLWDRFGAPIWNEMKKIGGMAWEKIQQFGDWIWSKTAKIREYSARAWTWFKNKLGIGEGPEGQNGLLQWVEAKASEAWDKIKDKLEPIKKPLMVLAGILVMLSPAGPVIAVGLAVGGIIEGVRAIKRYFGPRDGVISARVILQTVVLPKLISVIKGFSTMLAGKAHAVLGAITKARDAVRSAEGAAGASIFSFLASPLGWIAGMLDDFVAWGNKEVAEFLDWVDRSTAGLYGFLDRILKVLSEVGEVIKDILRLPLLLANKLWNVIPACIRDPLVDFFGVQILGRIAIFKTIAGTPEAWAKTKTEVQGIIKAFFVDFDLLGAMKRVFLLLLRALDVPYELFLAVVAKMVQAWDVIKEKPAEFLKNLFRTIGLALKLFFKDIGKHLIKGITGWLTKSLEGTKVYIPTSWTDFKEVLHFVASVLGLTFDHIMERLKLKVSAERYRQIQAVIHGASVAWEWLSLVLKGDFKGLWEKIKSKISDLGNMLMQAVVDWVVKEVAEAVMEQLLTTADPTGISETIMLIIDLYETIKTATQYAKQILTMLNKMLDSILGIASGALQAPAELIVGAMDLAMPAVIGLLANLAHLGDVGEGLRDGIAKIREYVDVGIDWVLDKAIGIVEAVAGAVQSVVGAVVDWWRKKTKTKVGEDDHTLEWEGEEQNAELFVHSRFMPLKEYLSELEKDPASDKKVIGKVRDLLSQFKTLKQDAKNNADKIEAAVNEIADLMPSILPSVNNVPPTVIVNSTTTVSGAKFGSCVVGESVKAEPLSNLPPTNGWTGSPPGGGNDFWKAVNQRKLTYVQGHLLNHNVHGPGKDENLVPITRSMNTLMAFRVEDDIKRLVRDEKKVVSYEIHVLFGGWSPPFANIEAENHLPTGMTFKASTMKKKTMPEGKDPNDWGKNSGDWEKDQGIPIATSLSNQRGDDGKDTPP